MHQCSICGDLTRDSVCESCKAAAEKGSGLKPAEDTHRGYEVSLGLMFVQLVLAITAIFTVFYGVSWGAGFICAAPISLILVYLAFTITKSETSVFLALLFFGADFALNSLLLAFSGFFNFALFVDAICVIVLFRDFQTGKKPKTEEETEAKDIIDEAIREVDAEDNKKK